jgi:hypothetical protein
VPRRRHSRPFSRFGALGFPLTRCAGCSRVLSPGSAILHLERPRQVVHDTRPIFNPPHYPPVFGLLGPSNNYYIQTRILPSAGETYESVLVPAKTFLRQDLRNQLSRWLWPWPIMGTCFNSSSPPPTLQSKQVGNRTLGSERFSAHITYLSHSKCPLKIWDSFRQDQN